eukprot:310798-Rhodomonas_salina.1
MDPMLMISTSILICLAIKLWQCCLDDWTPLQSTAFGVPTVRAMLLCKTGVIKALQAAPHNTRKHSAFLMVQPIKLLSCSKVQDDDVCLMNQDSHVEGERQTEPRTGQTDDDGFVFGTRVGSLGPI